MTDDKTPGKIGRACTGLYPEVSRTMLAEATGYHVSSITGMLKGRTRVNLATALKLAELIGVDVEKFSKQLDEQQKQYQAERAAKRQAGKAKRRKRQKHNSTQH